MLLLKNSNTPTLKDISNTQKFDNIFYDDKKSYFIK